MRRYSSIISSNRSRGQNRGRELNLGSDRSSRRNGLVWAEPPTLPCLMANPLCYGFLLNLQTDVICFSLSHFVSWGSRVCTFTVRGFPASTFHLVARRPFILEPLLEHQSWPFPLFGDHRFPFGSTLCEFQGSISSCTSPLLTIRTRLP